MLIVLSLVILIIIPILTGALFRINKLQYQLNLLDQEQHTQNKDIIELLKANDELTRINDEQDKAILFIIQHLVEKQKSTIPYMGPMGEA